MKLKKVMLMLCLCSSVFLMSCGKENKDNTKTPEKEITTQSDNENSNNEDSNHEEDNVEGEDEEPAGDKSNNEDNEPSGSNAAVLDGNADKVTNYMNHPESSATNKLLTFHKSGYQNKFYALTVELPDADLSQVVITDDGLETDTFTLDEYYKSSCNIHLRNDPMIIFCEKFFDPDATFIMEDGDWKVTEGHNNYYDFVYKLDEDSEFEFNYYCETEDQVAEILNLFKNSIHVYAVEEGNWTQGTDSQGNTVQFTDYTYLNDLVIKNFNDHGFRFATSACLHSIEDEQIGFHIPYEDSETDEVEVVVKMGESPRSSDTFEKTFACNGVVIMLNYNQDYNYVDGYFVTEDEEFFGSIDIELPYSIKKDNCNMDIYVEQIMKYLF